MLHIDLWGPFSVTTAEGYKHFLTIVDDHTRVTWVYLLRTKAEVLKAFPEFLMMIEKQYNAQVKGVRSDNAPELRFTELYKSKGIQAYHSCPETPEQNSVVERKHHHILNVARALMFQAHIPLEYWSDCILTAVFLINRLPSLLLKDKSPFQMLTHTKPAYNDLRVFGCLVYCSTSFNREQDLVSFLVIQQDIKVTSFWTWKATRFISLETLYSMKISILSKILRWHLLISCRYLILQW